ncbi:hypothetical protein PV328_006080 [Microctonus aethiopoides]|uniref:Exonuclease domain-containing protein n=1 Tax=Microctonus aethiopoides TaxID=144406 RepID=A0AA39FNQ8_9HYME|nr:hypothetical protein PV328_006080 [Microctonus aethiopoides]
MPTIPMKTFKRYEREIGPAIEKTARDSCKKAAEEERQLVAANIEKLCEFLPQEIVQEMYPHHKTLISAVNGIDENNNGSSRFDSAVGELVNIIVSYDMGWSRKKDDHDCRKNFEGSAKAMEADAGAALINDSKILKEANLAARVLIGDEDSSTISAVRRGNPNKIFKLSDRNHLKKNFSKDLYKLSNYKEMKKGTIEHVKKCFGYAIAQNTGNSANLAITLRSIPDHLFNSHENCGSWCSRKNGCTEQKIILLDASLYSKLSALFSKYAANAHKFSIATSSQSNESFNNIMAHKSPKNICYSQSESSSFRLASAVCTKNDGESYLLEVRKNLGLPPGQYASLYAKRSDNMRAKRSEYSKLPVAKKRRISASQKRENLKRKNENVEGIQYLSNVGFSESCEDSLDFHNSLLESTKIEITPKTCNIVYFDLETSGFSKSDEILQIAASCEGRSFSVYINPTKNIDDKASVHTGLKNIKGDLYLHGNKVLSVPLKDALQGFSQFLNLSSNPCLLVAHNVNFDATHLLRAIIRCSMVQNFNKIAGFADSLPLFKQHFGSEKVPGEFKLSTLAVKYLNVQSDDLFHEAMYDVNILEQLVALTNKNHLYESSKSYATYLNHLIKSKKIATAMVHLSPLKGVVSEHILRKMASEGIKYIDLLNKYESEGTAEFVQYLKNPGCDKKARVSKDKRVLDKLVKFFEKNSGVYL